LRLALVATFLKIRSTAMDEMIARPDGTTQRLFPPISPNLYNLAEEPANLTPDQQVARNLLALSRQDFSRWERFFGWKLDPPGRIGRLFLHHRMALEAELSGRCRRAQVIWNYVHNQLQKLCQDQATWEALVADLKQPGLTVLGDPAMLRARLVGEVFLDTHCAFYNGRIQAGAPLAPDDRAFDHLTFLENLLKFSELSSDDQLALLGPAKDNQITKYEEAGNWEQAIEISASMASKFPQAEPYQNKLGALVFAKTLSELSHGESHQENLADAKRLEYGIQRLHKFHLDYPHNVTLLDLLAYFHYLRAIKLGNASRVAEALVEVEKALIYNPSLEKGQETAEQLTEMMQTLQTQMEELEREIKYQPNTVLSEEGKRLRKQARKGFKLLNAYRESEELKRTLNAVRRAHGRQIWRDIGLPEPADGWEDRATALLGALGEVFNRPPQDKGKVRAAWNKVAKSDPSLADLDADLIAAYLAYRLFGADAENFQPKPDLPKPVDFPVLMAPDQEKRDWEPFGYWLFNKGDLRVKAQAGLAIILILVTGGFAVRELLHRNTRTAAYRQITQAVAHDDYLAMIQAAEQFFAATVLSLRDERDQRVKELYDQAMVRWFAGQHGGLNAEAQFHLKRYQALMVE
jgi:polyhydroxyalkanoate synthesis regulator phasin